MQSRLLLVLSAAGLLTSAPAFADPAVASFPLVAVAKPVEAFEVEPAPSAASLREAPAPRAEAQPPQPPPSTAPPRASAPSERAAANSPAADSEPRWTYLPSSSLRPAPTVDQRPELPPKRDADEWTFAVSAVTHAPVDLGGQVGLETPGRLRLSAGYGVMPNAYLGPLTDMAALMAGDNVVGTALREGSFSGRTWRIQAGLRPFANSGAYLEAGYASVDIEGQASIVSPSTVSADVPSGDYGLATHLDMWVVELGYRAKIAERVVLALAVGAMGTLNAETSITGAGAAQGNVDEQSAKLDGKLEEYGILPTLTLRLGMDLI